MLNIKELKEDAEFVIHKVEHFINNYQVYTQLVTSWEQLELKSYQDGGGVWTIGYGHIQGVASNLVICELQAYIWFCNESQVYINNVEEQLEDIDVNDIQKQALASLCYNIGITAFNNSTLLKTIKNDPKNIITISENWLSWDYDNGKEITGLLKRRINELNVYSNWDKI